jgi:hypothetical protein
MRADFDDICRVFALSEQEQAAYFPEWTRDVHMCIDVYDYDTRSSRDVALCVLAVLAYRGPNLTDEWNL